MTILYEITKRADTFTPGIVFANYIPIIHKGPMTEQEHLDWYIANGIDPSTVKPLVHPYEEDEHGNCLY